jgi:arylformamidase
MVLYDISPPIDADTPVWPGDTPFGARLALSIAAGDTVNLAAIATTPHLGAHADAPLHSEADGAAIDALPLEAFLGRCRVVEVAPLPLIGVGDVQGFDWDRDERLLLKTGSVADRRRFPERCSAVAPALAERCGRARLKLVGIDTPSVDPLASKTLEAHRILNRHRVVYLESLLLDAVPAGVYELIALPLRLRGLDASPVRAVLRALAPTK